MALVIFDIHLIPKVGGRVGGGKETECLVTSFLDQTIPEVLPLYFSVKELLNSL